MKYGFALAGVCLATVLGQSALAQDYTTGSTKTAPSTTPFKVGANLDVLNVNRIPGAVIGYGVNAGVGLNENVTAGLSLDYWSGKDNGPAVPLNANDLILGAFARAQAPTSALPFVPYVVGGVDVNRVSYKGGTNANLGPQGNEYQTSTRLGLNAGAGAHFPLAQDFGADAEIRYRYIFGPSDVQFNSLGLIGGLTYQM